MITLDKFIHDEATGNGYVADYKNIHAWAYINGDTLEFVSFVEFQSRKKDWGIQVNYRTKVNEDDLPLADEWVRENFELDIAEFILTHPELNEEIYVQESDSY